MKQKDISMDSRPYGNTKETDQEGMAMLPSAEELIERDNEALKAKKNSTGNLDHGKHTNSETSAYTVRY